MASSSHKSISDDNECILSDSSDTPIQRRYTRGRPPKTGVKAKSAAVHKIKKLQSDFLGDFDPERSSRERRKLQPKNYNIGTRKTMFDDIGRYRASNVDHCDCLDPQCTGCHYPCPVCNSAKCAASCRVHRKWAYETIEHDGKDLVITNKNLQ